MNNQPIATGRVVGLCINGEDVETINFSIYGPIGDRHAGLTRQLSGHDGDYIRTSSLHKGDTVFNWRSWTALATEEITTVENSLGCTIPSGCLLENLRIEDIPNFSKLTPGSRLVFPKRQSQAILSVWEENGPCHVVGQRLEHHYGVAHLSKRFITEARDKRGVMGFVLAPGRVDFGDSVLVYAPNK